MDENLLVSQRESGRDLSGPWRSLRPLGWGSLVFALLWVYGLGSLFAIGFALMGIVGRYNVASADYPPPGLRMCQVGLALGILGLVATAGLVLL